MIYFISGHRDITLEEFNNLYIARLIEVLEEDPTAEFVVGDYWGVDEMAQEFLSTMTDKVTVYHMFDKPRVYKDTRFKLNGGYKTDEERDAAMTRDSDIDIAFVRRGKRKSGTAQNIIRRYEF